MAKKQEVSILKPTIDISAAALGFAAGSQKKAIGATLGGQEGQTTVKEKKRPKTPFKKTSGLVPEGDIRLTANISEEHHMKLKIAAAQRRTTIGELIEQLVDNGLQ